MNVFRFRSATGFVFAAAFVAGCGAPVAPLPLANVTGDVKLDGQPLDNGTISFSTDGRSPQVFEIRGGKYTGAAMVGSNLVQISFKKPIAAGSSKDISGGRMAAMSKGQTGPPEEKTQDFGEEVIDASFNSKSKENRVVEAGGANKFDFDCKSAKK